MPRPPQLIFGTLSAFVVFAHGLNAQTCTSPVWNPNMGLPGFQYGAPQGVILFDSGLGVHPLAYGGMSRLKSHTGIFTLLGVGEWRGNDWFSLSGGIPDASQSGADVWTDVSGTSLLVTGNRGHFGTVYGGGVGRWQNGVWSAMGAGITGSAPTGICSVLHDDGTGLAWYVGGDFVTMDGVTCHGIAKWNGASWSALGTGLQGVFPYAYSLASYDEDGPGPKKPALFVVGDFDSAGNTSGKYVARWNGTAWSSVGTGTPFTDSPLHTIVADLDGPGPGREALYVCSREEIAFGTKGLVKKWDGVSWTRLGDGFLGQAYSADAAGLTVTEFNGVRRLVCSGNFTSADGKPANKIAYWTGTRWDPLPEPGVDHKVSLSWIPPGSQFGPSMVVGATQTIGTTPVGWVGEFRCPPCPSDFNNDGFVTGDDFDAFVLAFIAGDIAADFDKNSFVTGDDFDAFVLAFEAGC